MGTRFLPATKTVPKELLPVVDTPGIEVIAEEAADFGADRLVIVTAPTKREVLRHFRPEPELEKMLRKRGKTYQADRVHHASDIIAVEAVTQDRPLGLGHAVSLAKQVMEKDEDSLAVMLPDDIVMPMGVMKEMAQVREEFGGCVLCAFNVKPEQVSDYGVFSIAEDISDTVKRINGMVEKPLADEAPSTLVATGRYILDTAIFDALNRIEPGAGGELQLTDAIQLLIEEGMPVHIVVHTGHRHDLGNPGGFIKACIEAGVDNPMYKETLRKFIINLVKERGWA